jgi:hypothetical protein
MTSYYTQNLSESPIPRKVKLLQNAIIIIA